MTDHSMRTVALAVHEQYTSLLEAGFTRAEALYLVAAMATGGPKPPTTGDEGEGP